MHSSSLWVNQILEYCTEHNIPVESLPYILNDQKVIPMIRGKGFEFSAYALLKDYLPSEIWDIDKPALNAQFGSHDMDVRVIHKATNQEISVECKMASGDSVKPLTKGPNSPLRIRIKCMRSRTLGDEQAEKLATVLGISAKSVKSHRDSYRPHNFDVVLTTIGNAFYITDTQRNSFVWNPTEYAIEFLQRLGRSTKPTNLKDFAFNKMYVAKSEDIAVSRGSGIRCGRRNCEDKENCGFISNYPSILFDPVTLEVLPPWVELEESESLFEEVVQLKQTTGNQKVILNAIEEAIEDLETDE